MRWPQIFKPTKRVRLEIVPHSGILPIYLGSTRGEVRNVMFDLGFKEDLNERGRTLYCFENSIQVEFDDADRASFIGISSHSQTDLFFQGYKLFEMNAEQVFKIFQNAENGDHSVFTEYEHLFPQQIVTLYDADTQYDRRGERFSVWSEIGIGNKVYYEAVKGYLK